MSPRAAGLMGERRRGQGGQKRAKFCGSCQDTDDRRATATLPDSLNGLSNERIKGNYKVCQYQEQSD